MTKRLGPCPMQPDVPTEVSGWQTGLEAQRSQDKAPFLIPVLIRRGQDPAPSWKVPWLHFSNTLPWQSPWTHAPCSPTSQLRSAAGRQAWRPRGSQDKAQFLIPVLIRRGQDPAPSWTVPWLHLSNSSPWQGPLDPCPMQPYVPTEVSGWQTGLEAAGHRTRRNSLFRC